MNALEANKSYSLKNFLVREIQHVKYLSMSKEGSEIILNDDIGAVAEQYTYHKDDLFVIRNVTIMGMLYYIKRVFNVLSYRPLL